MGKMIRKQVYIEPRQAEALKRCARRQGVSEAELIRRGIDAVTGEPKSGEEARRLREEAWQRLEAFMEERSKLDVPQTGRQWTRD